MCTKANSYQAFHVDWMKSSRPMKLKLPFVYSLYTNMNEISSVCHHSGIWCQQRIRNIFEDLGNQLYTMLCKLMFNQINKGYDTSFKSFNWKEYFCLNCSSTNFIFKDVLKLIHSICSFTLHTRPQLNSWFLNCVKRSDGTQMTRIIPMFFGGGSYF